MRLRLAKKIAKTIGTADCRYSEGLRMKALDRLDKTRSEREKELWFHDLLTGLGAEGRAKILEKSFGSPAKAFAHLMRFDESDWPERPELLDEVFNRLSG